jgi:hypothetical protein
MRLSKPSTNLTFISFMAVAVVGCDPLGPVAPGSSGRWSPTPADEAFVDQLFMLAQPCCAKNGLDPSGRVGEWKQIILASGLSRDEALRSACLAELQAAAGSAACEPPTGRLDDPCLRLLTEPSGPALPGQTCTVKADCAGSDGKLTACLQSPARSVCASYTIGRLGDHPCVGSSLIDGSILVPADAPTGGFVCDPSMGLFCDSTSMACATRHGGGDACAANDACTSFTCSKAGICESVVPVGESCATAVCDGASYCASADLTCTAKLTDGASCMIDDECPGTCEQGICSPLTTNDKAALQVWCI